MKPLKTLDPALPGDWTPKRLMLLAVLGQLMMIAVAVRHEFIYGGSFYWLLHGFEAFGLLAATVVSALALSRVLRQASSLDFDFLVRVGLLLTLLATLAPPFLSDDVWDYLARGRLDWLGENTYTETVEAHRKTLEGLEPYAERARWTEWAMPYGPVAALLQMLASAFEPPLLAAYVWKVAMAVCHVLTAVLVLLTLRIVADEREARRGFVLWLWNPWLLLESCGSGHNDALLGMLLALSGYGIAKTRYFMSTSSYGLAMLVKHGSPPILPVWLAVAYHQRQLRGFALGSLATVGVVFVAYLAYWNVPGGLDWIINQNNVAYGSVSVMLGQLFGPWCGSALRMAGLLATLLVIGLACKRARDPQSAGRLAILAMVLWVLLFVPNFSPWYHLWWLPLFALANLPVLSRVLELLAWTGPLGYLVYAGTHGFGILHETWMLLLAGVWPCLLILLDWRSFVGKPPKPAAKPKS